MTAFASGGAFAMFRSRPARAQSDQLAAVWASDRGVGAPFAWLR